MVYESFIDRSTAEQIILNYLFLCKDMLSVRQTELHQHVGRQRSTTGEIRVNIALTCT